MKLLGKSNGDKYICEVDACELRKFMTEYYGSWSMPDVGETIDLAMGHDHLSKIKEAVKKMQELIDASDKVTEAMKACRILVKRSETIKK